MSDTFHFSQNMDIFIFHTVHNVRVHVVSEDLVILERIAQYLAFDEVHQILVKYLCALCRFGMYMYSSSSDTCTLIDQNSFLNI